MAHYLATLSLVSPIEIQPASGRNLPSVVVQHNDTHILAQVPRWLVGRLSEAPEGPQRITLHPKTDREGVLAPTSRLAAWRDPKDEEEGGHLHVVGQVVYIDLREARLVLRVHPNPQGRLRKAFLLTVQSPLEVLANAPKQGSGVIVKGILKTPSKRLVITDLQPIPLPLIRKDKAETPQAKPKQEPACS